jgi:1,4-alpha-glucan branching enzyme
MKNWSLVGLLVILVQTSFAQVVTLDPVFATQHDSVTIYFDASEGNGDLAGIVPVYAHTGVITNSSTSPTDWQNVQGNWGSHDSKVLMTHVSGNIHKLKILIHDFYLLSSTDTVYALAFVFRNGAGTTVGRAADGGDIFVPIYQQGFAASITTPTNGNVVNIQDNFDFSLACSDTAQISLFVDGAQVGSTVTGLTATENIVAANYSKGKHYLSYSVMHDAITYTDSIHFVSHGVPVIQNPPAGTLDGINYISNTSVILQLFAPYKDFVYAIGDFSDWELDEPYFMKLNADSTRYWIQLDNLDPDKIYRFQYQIDEEGMRVADVYSELILSPWNDQYISDDTYPNMTPYPTDTTDNPVGVFQINKPGYSWANDSYTQPASENLIIYELLIRDFLANHDYKTVLDSLTYLSNLGVNAIELLPVNQFEGNISWGYNPAFYFAPDKYYGPEVDFKTFVDSCHGRGIAVIMDIALNHSFGQNPQVRMYFDQSAGQWGQPLPNSPWFNEVPKHDFNVGYDYNHESLETRAFSKRVFNHWVDEFHIDGYRLDLSKGFTQKNTLGNTGAWGQFDSTRVAILEDYANSVWINNPNVFMILEHLADNDEEKYLSSKGFMLWGNINHEYSEAAMGYPSDLSWASYKKRGWAEPNLVSYSCSHDEERLMFKNIQYGNSNGSYNTKDLNTGLARVEAANLFLYAIPGPKMIWQFDEVGYDYSINTCEDGTIDPDCRVAPKPIRWDYMTDSARTHLYNVTQELFVLKKTQPAFRTSDYTISVTGFQKRIVLKHADMNVVALGNFDVSSGAITGNFPHTGMWYNYFTGDSINVTDVSASISLNAGEYILYLDKKLPAPDLNKPISTNTPVGIFGLLKQDNKLNFELYPNPAKENVRIEFSKNTVSSIAINVYNMMGRKVATIAQNEKVSGSVLWEIPVHFAPGFYFVSVVQEGKITTKKLIIE